MAETAKGSIISRAVQEGHTDGYGTLVHLTASMGSDPKALGPNSTVELAVWRGHFEGLRAALLCLAMHERQLDPEVAARVVGRHLEDAMSELEPGDDTGTKE